MAAPSFRVLLLYAVDEFVTFVRSDPSAPRPLRCMLDDWAQVVTRALTSAPSFVHLDEFCMHVDLFACMVRELCFHGCAFRPLCVALLSAVDDWEAHQGGRVCDTGRSSARRLCRSMAAALQKSVRGGRRMAFVVLALRLAGGRQWEEV
jgi:hypothetical protein